MAETTTTTQTEFIPTIISTQVELTARDMRAFRPLITEIPFTGPGGTLNLNTLDAPAASSYTEGDARTFTAGNVGTAKAITPAEVDVAISITDKLRRRSVNDQAALYAPELARAVAVKMDSDCASEYANATASSTDEGDTAASLAKLLTALRVVKVAAKDQWVQPAAVLHTSAWENLIQESNLINAQVRGNSQGVIGGTVDLLGGVQIAFTTAINSAGSPAKYQNMVFTKRAIALGWKSELNVEMWRDENNKAMRIAAGADYDYVTRIPGESAVYTVTV